ncbi:enoyl-CoA hydratase/isomerase family protein [Nocardioides campestrisoli]|uniref:enoyl-CoA hydratase/isomerase family protein n=1 Tax=Nocardioides campestrisoli TaxID=2736757 RepID=UPI0015E64854|nr:enoyl-CoA hydratase-related protein [Nocardioides campestrisoli]
MTGLRVEDRGAVRVLTLDRPERRNALDLPDRRVLLAALREASADPALRALVLTGAGTIFSAGGDISSMSPDPEVALERLELVNGIARELVHTTLPVVSAVEGGAFGLGLSLTCAGDLVVAGESSRFSASFARIGLVADTGLSWTLPRRIGPGRARAMLLTARTVGADEAERIGLVDELVPDGQTLDRALELADQLAAFSAPATAITKRLAADSGGSLDELLAAETHHQIGLLGGPDFAEGRDAFFARRPAAFSQPRPDRV